MAGVMINVVDLLLFYTSERVLFNRMVRSMNKNPQLVKMCMAFWLLLEEIGYRDVTRSIHSFDELGIEAVFQETLSCLECIQLPNPTEPECTPTGTSSSNDAPLLVGLLDEPISRRFFFYNRDFMSRRLLHILETVCDKIFGESAAIEVDQESRMRPIVARYPSDHHHQGSSSRITSTDHCHEAALISSLSSSHTDINKNGSSDQHRSPRRGGVLNPNASEFVPVVTISDDSSRRTMFLTFSRGYPLTRQEIIDFFTRNWGDVVQDVVVEQPGGGGRSRAALYGRAIFKSQAIIPLILNGQSKAKFVVGSKHLWARVYVPRRP